MSGHFIKIGSISVAVKFSHLEKPCLMQSFKLSAAAAASHPYSVLRHSDDMHRVEIVLSRDDIGYLPAMTRLMNIIMNIFKFIEVNEYYNEYF